MPCAALPAAQSLGSRRSIPNLPLEGEEIVPPSLPMPPQPLALGGSSLRGRSQRRSLTGQVPSEIMVIHEVKEDD